MKRRHLKLISHSNQRLEERFGLSSGDLQGKSFECIRRDTNTRTLCRYSGTRIYFILSKPTNKIVTFLTIDQVVEKFGLDAVKGSI